MWGSCFSCTATSHIFVLDYVTIKELLSKFLTRQQKKKEKKRRHFAYNPISAYFPCTSVFHLYALVHCKRHIYTCHVLSFTILSTPSHVFSPAPRVVLKPFLPLLDMQMNAYKVLTGYSVYNLQCGRQHIP